MTDMGIGKEDIRCGFTVSGKRKRIWKIQLGLLSELHRVCRKYGLRYYAANGTLLGAIRHGGFIPWDDDLDVMMPRADYEKFCAVAGNEFESPVYFQDGMFQKGYYRMYARLRNAETTAVPKMDIDTLEISGIFIDIFPIDGMARFKWQAGLQKAAIKLMDDLAVVHVYKDAPAPAWKKIPARMLMKLLCVVVPFEKYQKLLRNLEQKYADSGSGYVFIYTHYKMLIMKKRQLSNVKWLDYEDTRIPVPGDYDSILKDNYGDYMKLPPMEERGKHHNIFIDPDRPYSYYFGKLSKEEFDKGVNDL